MAAAQPAGSALLALLRDEQQQQQPGASRDVDPQHAARTRTGLSCQVCSSGDAATETVRSWYGQRVWTRAPPVQLAPGVSPVAAAAGAGGATAASVGAAGDVNVTDTAHSPPQSQAWKFSVMCYNILADTYAQYFAPKLYRDVPRQYLDWHHRLRLLVEEIRHWGPDVVCLQEVQHYDELETEMRAAGYEGRFMRRTGRRRDGCATFWRSDRLRACSIQRLDFAPLGLEDNVAMLLSLVPRCEGEQAAGLDSHTAEALSGVRLLVATTHITFDPAKGDVKLGQVRTLLSRAADLAAHPPPEEPEEALLHPHRTSHGHRHHHHYYSHNNLVQHHQEQQHLQQHHQRHQPHHNNYHHHHQQSPQDGQGTGYPLRPVHQYGESGHHLPGLPEGAAVVGSPGTLAGSWSSPSLLSSLTAGPGALPVEGRWRRPPVAPRPSGGPSSVEHPAGPAPAAETAPHEPQGAAPQQQPAGRPLQTLAIITGDFNSTAGSPLYQFVARGALDLSRTNRKKLSGQLHGVCHTQYKPVSEVKQLHAQRTAAAAAANAATAATADAATTATPAAEPDAGAVAGSVSGEVAETPTVTVVDASPPGTPPSTPSVAAARAAAAAAAAAASAMGPVEAGSSGPAATSPTPAAVAQRLASAAMDSAASAISACTAKAASAVSCPVLASPAARAAAAIQVLDAFLGSAAAATGLHPRAVERWSEKELRSAMGDQYETAAVQGLNGGGGGSAAPGRALPTSASLPALAGAPPQQPRMGRQHNSPPVSRHSLSGTSGAAAAAGGTGGGSRRSLDLPNRAGAEADAALEAPASAPLAPGSPSGALVVRHPLRLKSSYVEVARAEPAFTSIHSGFMGTVDFIWYTADAILQQQQQPQPERHVVVSGRSGDCSAAAEVYPRQSQACSTLPPRPQTRDAAISGYAAAAVGSSTAAGCGDGALPAFSTCPSSSSCSHVAGAGRRFQLVPVAVLQPPDLELLPRGLPAAGWGSDHVCVMTQFELRPM